MGKTNRIATTRDSVRQNRMIRMISDLFPMILNRLELRFLKHNYGDEN